MAVNPEYLSFIEDQLSVFGAFDTKRMFGGIGFFRDGKMFGMIGNGVFRLKADDSNKEDYESLGIGRFMAGPGKKGLPYYEVPLSVLEDKEKLREWAEKSVAINRK